MKWIKIEIKTTTEAVDFISNLLDEIGLEGIQIEDNIPISEEDKKAMFIDILPKIGPDDGTAFVSSYVEADRDVKQLVKEIQKGLEQLKLFVNVGEANILVEETNDEDWLHNWKAFFKPFRIAEDIVIKPTWEKLEEKQAGDLIVEIDPGIAFGTGAHETTKLCILGLRKYITKETKLLDVGCGSGILSIIGLKLGAESAVLTDIDPAALVVTNENLKVNQLSEQKYDVLQGNIMEDITLQNKVGIGLYDIVVANILADVIIPLSKEVRQHLKKEGLFLSSGIIHTKKQEVQDALIANNFDIIEVNEMGDWVSFVAKKREI